ncbi:SurA N-terminal domain-containing protein [Pokkaliibacter sp. CJK22405]|uniref:SurA N-terminal domain-containing protein n=1 Tax=Pokkaliibacter sp. CJK22405 TaxID=3384615 RepID=UPI003984AC0B
MLQSIRDKSTGILTKVIIGFIIFVFAIFGVESLISLANSEPVPATVNGDDIKTQELNQMVELQRRQLYNRYGSNVDPAMLQPGRLQAVALNRLIQEKLLIQEAEKRGLMVSDSMVDQMIVMAPDFQVDGKFDQQRYQQVLANVGLTPSSYHQMMKKNLLIGQLEDTIGESAFVMPSELDAIMALNNQLRDIKYQAFTLNDYLGKVSPSDEQLQAYYNDHKSDFMAPEEVAVNYIELDKALLTKDVTVDEAQVQSDYDAEVKRLKGQKNHDIAHILIAVNDGRDDAEAKKRAEEVEQKLKSGEGFAALAKEYSDDDGSKDDGGELGTVQPGVLGDALDKAIATMKPGDISKPVKSDYGYHIVKLVSLTDKEIPTFDQLKPKLEQQQRDAKAAQLFGDKADQLADLVFSSSDLQEPAKELGLSVQKAPLFSRDNAPGVLNNAKVLDKVFSPDFIDEGVNSDPIQVGTDHIVVVRIADHQASRQLGFDEVKEQVTEVVKRQQATDLAKKDAKAAEESAQASPEIVQDWQTKANLSRSTAEDQALAKTVFAMPKPEDGKPSFTVVTTAKGDIWTVALTSVQQKANALPKEQLQGITSYMANQEGSQAFQAFVNDLRSKAKIETR